MPYFLWIGRDKSKNKIAGKLFGRSKEKVEELLIKQKIILFEIREASINKRFSDKLMRDISIQLSNFLSAGICLDEALEILSSSLKNLDLKMIFGDCVSGVREGISFGNMLDYYKNFFSPVFILLIKAGEEAGNLEKVFKLLGVYYGDQEKIKGKIKSSLLLPIITFITFILIFIGVLFFIIPRFEQLFLMLGKDIPSFTQRVFALSNYLRSYYFVFTVLSIVLGSFVCWFIFSSKKFKFSRDKFLLKVPLVRKFIWLYNIMFFLKIFNILLEGKIHLLKAFRMALNIVKNLKIKFILDQVGDKIEAGENLVYVFSRYGFNDFAFWFSMGAKIGKVEFAVSRLLREYEDKFYRFILLFSKILPVVLIFLIAILIGLLVVAIYIPIFSFSKLV